MEGKIDIHKFLKEMSDILSEKYDMDIKITARPKEEAQLPDKQPA